MKIRNYCLHEFCDLTTDEVDTYAVMIANLLPVNKLSGREFKGLWSSEYSSYVTIKAAFTQQMEGWQLQAIQAAYGLTSSQQMFCRVFDYYAALRYVENDLIAILERERNLPSKKDPDLKAAGIDRLNKYGDVLTIDSLARTYNCSWEEVGKWKYSKIYTILAMENERDQGLQ